MATTSYDVKKVNMSINGRIITGFAQDGAITVTKSADSVTPVIGSKGDVSYTENSDESGTVALMLMATSSSLSYIRKLAASRKNISINISDANEEDAIHISEEDCRIMKMPDINRGKDQQSVTVTIFVPHLNIR